MYFSVTSCAIILWRSVQSDLSLVISRPHRLGALCNDGWCLSVCLCLTLSREWKGVASGQLQEGSPWHWWPWPQLELERSRSPGRLMLRQKMCHIFGMGRPMNFKLVIRMEYDDDDPHSRRVQWPQGIKGHGYNVTSSVWRMFAHNLTNKLQILVPPATWQIKIKMITIFCENYIDNITLQCIT